MSFCFLTFEKNLNQRYSKQGKIVSHVEFTIQILILNQQKYISYSFFQTSTVKKQYNMYCKNAITILPNKLFELPIQLYTPKIKIPTTFHKVLNRIPYIF